MKKILLVLKTILFLNVAYCSSILSKDTPEVILKASKKYEDEKEILKSYTVEQTVTSEIVSDGKTTIEKRKQIGYFELPSTFIVTILSRDVNGVRVSSSKEVDKSIKKETQWINKSEVQNHIFEPIAETENVIKFKVTPKERNKDSKKGEIWIQKQSFKIVRIIREPSILEEGYELYRTEVFFEKDLEFQEPTYTKLNAKFIKNGSEITARVEAMFDNYKFKKK
ncbi:MAG: hypothetical protein SFU98_21805 [Leptospiraceae bacterium]|nr:hypothetical protein [Leptospiraceae bacterium]